MTRKEFIKAGLLTAGGYFIAHSVVASDILPERRIVAFPKKDDYRFNTDGEVFINTHLGFYDLNQKAGLNLSADELCQAVQNPKNKTYEKFMYAIFFKNAREVSNLCHQNLI